MVNFCHHEYWQLVDVVVAAMFILCFEAFSSAATNWRHVRIIHALYSLIGARAPYWSDLQREIDFFLSLFRLFGFSEREREKKGKKTNCQPFFCNQTWPALKQ